MPSLYAVLKNQLRTIFRKKLVLTDKEKSLRTIRSIYHKELGTILAVSPKKLEVENIFIIPAGILVFYHLQDDSSIMVYSMLFEHSSPKHILWTKPKLITQFAKDNHHWQFVTLNRQGAAYESVWSSHQIGLILKHYPNYLFTGEVELKNPTPKLSKDHGYNPLISPHNTNVWESFTTFNPAAFYAANKVHILYRAQGSDYVSKVGYATSQDGLTINHRHPVPIYVPTMPFEGVSLPPGDPYGRFSSGGGSGGVEDPRITQIGDRLYMTYVAYDGWSPPRIAISSIALTDFLSHNFLWTQPVLISPPGVVDKSAVIFPEKINGKYVILHRVFPDILIDYVDTLAFNGQTFLTGHAKISPRNREWWDSRKIGAGAPPLKTDAGWLLIYQGVDDKDASEYKVGAMLLDKDDPAKVLARSSEPILLPREKYENVGFKAGVVYPCGAIIKDDTLFVYYGGADSYVCVATASLHEFVHDLLTTGTVDLENINIGLTQQGV